MASLPDVQVFTAGNWQWTKPSKATVVEVILVGAGGGGASGRRDDPSGNFFGGGAGAGGNWHQVTFRADDLLAVENLTVGAGGLGGASVTTDDTAPNNGQDGGDTIFGTTLKVTASGGQGGQDFN